MINTDALTARCINFDSRVRVSGEAGDMIYQLEEPVHLPRNAVCWLTAASIPKGWRNLTEGVNDILTIQESNEWFRTSYPFNLETQIQTYTVPIPELQDGYTTNTELSDAVMVALNHKPTTRRLGTLAWRSH